MKINKMKKKWILEYYFIFARKFMNYEFRVSFGTFFQKPSIIKILKKNGGVVVVVVVVVAVVVIEIYKFLLLNITVFISKNQDF